MPSADELLARLEPLGMRLSLEPFRRLLTRLGDPQRALPAVLVAGTNGKGSTAALLAAIGCAAGYRTGLYTSPHLEEPRERLRIDGLAVATLELDRLVADVVDAGADELPTPFEALTAAAFLAFAEADVELAVLEVGLGGRLDATNAADPLLSIVTPIALDHREQLGDTLAAIAGEKAGVMRAGRPTIAWEGDAESAAALRAAASAVGTRLSFAADEASVTGCEPDERDGGQPVVLRTSAGERRLRLPLAGEHQRRNLALAAVAAERLATLGLSRLRDAVGDGVEGCKWPGRLESVALPGGPTVLLDGAHNSAGAQALAEYLRGEDRPWDLAFGTLADKDAGAMAAILAPRARRVFLAPPASPRALGLADLVALPALGGATPGGGVGDALEGALAAGAPLLVVTGSLYLVGEARSWLRRHHGAPAPAAELPTWVPPPVS